MSYKTITEIFAVTTPKDSDEEVLNEPKREIYNKRDVENAILKIKKIRQEIKEDSREKGYLEIELQNKVAEIKKKREKVKIIESAVRNYGELLRKENPERKTFYLDNGKLRFASRNRKWVYLDEEEFVKICEDSGMKDVIQNKKRVHKTNFKSKVKIKDNGRVINPETNKIINGVRLEERNDYFRVNTNE